MSEFEHSQLPSADFTVSATLTKSTSDDDSQSLLSAPPHTNGVQSKVSVEDAADGEEEEEWGDFAAPTTTTDTPLSTTSAQPAPPASTTDAPLLTTPPTATATATAPANTTDDDEFAGFDEFQSPTAPALPTAPITSSPIAGLDADDEPTTAPVLSNTSSLPPTVPIDALTSSTPDADLIDRIAALKQSIDEEEAPQDDDDDFASFAFASTVSAHPPSSNTANESEVRFIDRDGDEEMEVPTAGATVVDDKDDDDGFGDFDAAPVASAHPASITHTADTATVEASVAPAADDDDDEFDAFAAAPTTIAQAASIAAADSGTASNRSDAADNEFGFTAPAQPTSTTAATQHEAVSSSVINLSDSNDSAHDDLVSVAPSGAAAAAAADIPPPTDDSASLLINEASHPVPDAAADNDDFDFGDFTAPEANTTAAATIPSDIFSPSSSSVAAGASTALSDGLDTVGLPPLTSPSTDASSVTANDDAFAAFFPASNSVMVPAAAPHVALSTATTSSNTVTTLTDDDADFGAFEPAPASSTISPRTATSSAVSSSLDLTSLLSAPPSASSASLNSLDLSSFTSSTTASPPSGTVATDAPTLSFSADDFDTDSVAFTAVVSPGATVHTTIQFPSVPSVPAADSTSSAVPVTVSSSPIPSVSEDVEDDWGDFGSAPAASAVASLPISAATSSAASGSATPDVSQDKGDWAGFDDADTTPHHFTSSSSTTPIPASTSHSPLPTFPDASSSPSLPHSISTDFLTLKDAAFTADVTQKIASLFADVLSTPITALQPSAVPTAFVGPPCVSCGAATPAAASSGVLRMVPRFCLCCGRPVSGVVASSLGAAGVVLPKWKTTVSYASLFVSLGLPMPAPATPKLTKDKKGSAAGADDEDGLKVQAGDEGGDDGKEEESDEPADKEKEKPTQRTEPEREKKPSRPASVASPPPHRSTPSPLPAPAPSPSVIPAADKPKPALISPPPATKLPDKPSSAEKAQDGRRTPNQLPTASKAEKAKEEERERERDKRTKAEQQAMRDKDKEKDSAKSKTGGMLGGISGKLKSMSSAAMASSITQSISSGLASISPQHAQQKQKQQQQQQAMEKAMSAQSSGSSSATSSGNASPRVASVTAAGPATTSSVSAASDVDIAALVKRIEQLVAALPNLDYVRERMED